VCRAGGTLLDVISSAMNISMWVLRRAETRYAACSDLARAVTDLSAHLSSVHGQKVLHSSLFLTHSAPVYSRLYTMGVYWFADLAVLTVVVILRPLDDGKVWFDSVLRKLLAY
jgi:hypothetical protein